jgi:succinate dehydrogenase/fumarate reductase-like Fe-S protein
VISKNVTLRVFRFNPDKDIASTYSSYEIPYGEGMTIHIALKYIYETLDNTLAFKDSCCYSLKCYGCVVRVNGKEVRACATPVSPGQTYTVDPVSVHGIIRDLVVHAKFRVPTPSFKNLYSAVASKGLCTACGTCVDACPHGFIQLAGDKPVITTMLRQDWCPVGDTLECGECVAACPVYRA